MIRSCRFLVHYKANAFLCTAMRYHIPFELGRVKFKLTKHSHAAQRRFLPDIEYETLSERNRLLGLILHHSAKH